MSNGYGSSKLAVTILKAVGQRMGDSVWLELGTIQADLSLLPDKFPVPIPPSDYLVSRWLSGYTGQEVTVTTADLHIHEATVTTTKLQPGDRVLIAWVSESDPVILDVVVSGSA